MDENNKAKVIKTNATRFPVAVGKQGLNQHLQQTGACDHIKQYPSSSGANDDLKIHCHASWNV